MRSIVFSERNRSGNVLHVETPLGIVNIRVGLRDAEGRRVNAVEVIPNAYAGEPVVSRDGLANTRLIEERIEEPELMATVYVVAFQHRVPGEGVGGFDWRATRAEVEAIEAERAEDGFYGPEYEHAIFPFDVPAGLNNDEMTGYIDARYIDALCAAVSKGAS